MRIVPRGIALAGLLAVLSAGACHGGPASSAGRVPAPPTTPVQDLGPSTPPVTWISGVVLQAGAQAIRVRQADGAEVSIGRLASGGTRLFSVGGGAWRELGSDAAVPAGRPVCVETLLDGSDLVALRVFLGAGCGPV